MSQSDYKYGINGCQQVITGVEFNRTTVTHGAHHVIHLIWPYIEKQSRSKFLPWSWFEPPTSYLAVQHATARPRRTPVIISLFH